MKALKNISPKQKRNLVIAIVVIVIVFVFYKNYKKLKYTTVPFDANNLPQIQTGGNGQSIPWNPEPLAREVFENIEGYNLRVYPETSEKILNLNNDQLIYLYNYYNRYLAQEYDTITQLFENEWNGWTGFGGGMYNEVVAKFKSLGLN